jgi:hypothetical protein
MKIVIATAFWQRPDILRFYINGAERLISDFKDQADIKCVLIGSPEDKSGSKDVIPKTSRYIFAQTNNVPLGAKWNAAVLKAKEFKPDYVLFMGSDNIMSSNLFYEYMKYVKQGFDMVGTTDIYFINLITRQISYSHGYTNNRAGETIGPGRLLSGALLDKLGWKPYTDDLAKGLDGSMQLRLAEISHTIAKINCAETKGLLADIKGWYSLSKLETPPDQQTYPIQHVLGWLPEEEAGAIIKYELPFT